ncbi:hypothetical protein [Clostridium sp.]|uniref:hypothetical protein n=1 Tax=Clostridium sp. TaxID=1506 RepID=UPI003F374BAF
MGSVKLKEIVTKYIKTPLGLEHRYFVQFDVSYNKEVSPVIIRDFCINGSITGFKVNKAKFVDTMEGKSIDGQYLTGKSLFIIGTVNLDLILKSVLQRECKYVISECIPFSTFIVVPKEICSGDNINIGYYIEDFDIVKIDHNKIFISILLIMQYEDFI